MAHSLEVRVPFLDHKIVEYAATVPTNLKLNGLVSKYILKESYNDILPPEILSRKKMGFSFPWSRWLRQDKLKSIVDDCLSKNSIQKRSFFNYKPLQKVYNDFYQNKNCKDGQVYLKVWMLTVLELWCRKHLDE